MEFREVKNYAELDKTLSLFNSERGYSTKGTEEYLVARIIFTKDSFDKEYSEESRTYEFTSDNKRFIPGQIGQSIFANCLDGTDPYVRLDWYMFGEDSWEVEKCFVSEVQSR